MKTKICALCKHHYIKGFFKKVHMCGYHGEGNIDPISGKQDSEYCYSNRYWDRRCGAEAKWYEPWSASYLKGMHKK